MWQGRKKRLLYVSKEPNKCVGAGEVGTGSLG